MSGESTRELHPLESAVLSWLVSHSPAAENELPKNCGLDAGSCRRAVQWLLSRGLADAESSEVTISVELGPLGLENGRKGFTPETAMLKAVAEGAKDLRVIQEDDLFDRGRWGSAMGAMLKAGVLRRGPEGLSLADDSGGVFARIWEMVYLPLLNGSDLTIDSLPRDVSEEVVSRAPKRGRARAEFILNENASAFVSITEEGRKALRESLGKVTIGRLTREMLASEDWRKGTFRRYSVDFPPARIHIGRHHPYGVFLDAVREKLLAMGFQEMKGPLAESEFWNNDALFMPQFHPARDIHDAYYLEDGVKVAAPDRATGERVKAAHENGGPAGGRGWEYSFDWKRSLRAIMRSQGTALSARTLASNPSVPGKYFGIAKCFRYDQVDATHLPDFFQVEGIVLGENINLRHLLGLLKLFATEVAGAKEYKFVPAYFPFTEPSVEVHIKHPELGWFEMGGAGLFRREVCLPLGVKVPVIAWGLGLDRMALMALGLSDIRDLLATDLSRLRAMRFAPENLMGGGENA